MGILLSRKTGISPKLGNNPGQIGEKVTFSGDSNLLFVLHGTERSVHINQWRFFSHAHLVC